MKLTHKICTFTFDNGTSLRAAVPVFTSDNSHKSFDLMMSEAKLLVWDKDESGRGPVTSFTIGDWIAVG